MPDRRYGDGTFLYAHYSSLPLDVASTCVRNESSLLTTPGLGEGERKAAESAAAKVGDKLGSERGANLFRM